MKFQIPRNTDGIHSKLNFKYVALYVLFIVVQLFLFTPSFVLGLNIPLLFTYLFDLRHQRHIVKLREAITVDTSFIILLFLIGSIALILAGVSLLGTTLLMTVYLLLWD